MVVHTHAVFSEEFPDIADGKLLFEKVFQFFGGLAALHNDFAHGVLSS
jgi:hypothetical protein